MLNNKIFIHSATLTLLALVLISSLEVTGQTHERVTVIGTFEPSLGDFSRIAVTPEAVQADFKPAEVTYTFLDKVIETQTELESIAPLQITPDARSVNYHNYIKAAMGSRLSPYFIYRHYSPVSRNTHFGLGVRHFSSWVDMADYAPADFMQNRLNLNIDHSFRTHALGLEVFYQYNTNRFYGFLPDENPFYEFDKSDILQKYTTFGGSVGFQSKLERQNSLHHNIGLSFYNINDNYGSTEGGTKVRVDLLKEIQLIDLDNKQSLALDTELEHYNNKDTLGSANAMKIGLTPAFVLDGRFYFIKAGVSFNLESGDSSRMHLYPAILSKLFLLESSVELYANFTGGLNRKSLKLMADENPFISPIIPHQWENVKFQFSGGVKAAFIRNLELHLGVKYANIDNKAFYITDGQNPVQNSFTLVFDDLQLFSFTAEAAYRFTNVFGVQLGYTMHEYTLQNESHPWNEPLSRFTGKIEINATAKLGFQAELITIGERFAPLYTTTNNLTVEEIQTLEAATDLNLGVVYKFSERFNTFVTLNNVLNNKYQKYLNYPVYGFQMFIGLNYSF